MARAKGVAAPKKRPRKSGRSAARPKARGGAPGPGKRKSKARAPGASSPRRWLPWLIAGPLLGVALIYAGLLGWGLLPGPGSGQSREIVLRTVAPDVVSEELERAGLTDSPVLFSLYLRLTGVNLRPGAHLVSDGLSPHDLVQRLARISGRSAVRVTFPEGYNLFQVAARLEKAKVCGKEAFIRAAHDRRLRRELGIKGPSVEGFLFPATYELPLDEHPDTVVRRLVVEMRARLEQILAPHQDSLRARGYDVYDVLTLASLVEKETGLARERPLVASVLLNRLTKPGFSPRRLQSDPSSGYGCLALRAAPPPSCEGYSGRITPAMNRDRLNTYSTYVHDGLPPGPIANPGEAAIEAVVNPTQSDYLYFVASGRGGHIFSKTYAEHRAAIRGN